MACSCRWGSAPFLATCERRGRYWQKTTAPALVIWGERDPYIPPEHAERQREAFPDARVETFPDSGHWPFVDNADRTRALVTGFLRPRMRVSRPSLRRGTRRFRVRVRVEGALPALRVRARLRRSDRSGRTGAVVGVGVRPRDVHGTGTVAVTIERPLRPGRYLLVVRARGIPVHRLRLHVRG